MKISELIERLQQARVAHGDLPVITPGLDEFEFEDVSNVDYLIVNDDAISNKYRLPDPEKKIGFPVICIDWRSNH